MSSNNYHCSAAHNNCHHWVIVELCWISVLREPETLCSVICIVKFVTYYLKGDIKCRMHLLNAGTIFFIMCLHIYPNKILLASPQRISAIPSIPKHLSYLYAVYKTEHTATHQQEANSCYPCITWDKASITTWLSRDHAYFQAQCEY